MIVLAFRARSASAFSDFHLVKHTKLKVKKRMHKNAIYTFHSYILKIFFKEISWISKIKRSKRLYLFYIIITTHTQKYNFNLGDFIFK